MARRGVVYTRRKAIHSGHGRQCVSRTRNPEIFLRVLHAHSWKLNKYIRVSYMYAFLQNNNYMAYTKQTIT